MYEVFASLDTNGNGTLETDELKQMLINLGTPANEVTDEKVKETLRTIDKRGNGVAQKDEFVEWYTRWEGRIKAETRKLFDSFDDNNSGTISGSEVEMLLESLGNHVTEKDVPEALKAMGADANVRTHSSGRTPPTTHRSSILVIASLIALFLFLCRCWNGSTNPPIHHHAPSRAR